MSKTDSAPSPEAGARIRETVEHALRRGLVGLEYFSIDDADVGATPKDTIFARGTLKLNHYRPMTDEIYRAPLLIVTSLVSKPYILDLTPGQSMVEFLVKQGYDVYLIDWGVPRREDSRLRLEDYVFELIPACIDAVLEESGVDVLTMLGYCLGGTLALLHAATHPEQPLRALACLTTPVNFREMGLFAAWTDERYFDVDRVVDTLGNVPPELLLSAFDMLRPTGRISSPLQIFDRMRDDRHVKSFMMFDRWAADQIPFPGECFRQLVRDLFWDNGLVNGTLRLQKDPVLLADVTVPIFHATAEHDHIVPAASSRQLIEMVGSQDKAEFMLRGGHASLVAGGNALYRLWPKLDQWLSIRSV